MRLLIRLLIVALCAVLLVTTWWSHVSVGVSSYGHDTFYTVVHPYVRQTREWSLFGVLAICLIVARRDPTFTRMGLVTVILSLAILLIPPRAVNRDVQRTVEKIDTFKLNASR